MEVKPVVFCVYRCPCTCSMRTGITMCTNVWFVMWWSLFSEPTLKKEYCSVELIDAKYKAFVYAIDNHYWYQMYIGKCLWYTDSGFSSYTYNRIFVLYSILCYYSVNLLFVLHNYEITNICFCIFFMFIHTDLTLCLHLLWNR